MVDLQREIYRRTGDRVWLTQYDISAINYAYNITKKDEFHHHTGIQGAPRQYSEKYAEWIIERVANDPNFVRTYAVERGSGPNSRLIRAQLRKSYLYRRHVKSTRTSTFQGRVGQKEPDPK